MVARERLIAVWRRTVRLSTPIAVQQAFTTLMRTVDLIVAGVFGPAAVAAVGLADLYAQVPLRVGLALGTGAIALSSQDTGRGAETTRNRAITQAWLLGAAAGLPLILVGLTMSEYLISLLGAEHEVVVLGGLYLTLVFAAAPMRIVGLVGARSLQGTGDTVTPMFVTGGANLLNAMLTVVLALGVGPAPELGVLGIGLATLIARTVEASLLTLAIASPWTGLAFARPRSITITRQLVGISVPNFAEGMSTSIANFPFNALLLVFGTEVNAAYHIARRIYQQFTGPIYRSINTVASIIVGQTLGEGDPAGAREAALAITALSVLVMSGIGGLLIAGASPIAAIFTGEPATLRHAITFTRVFGISLVFMGVFFPIAGTLRGAGETRIPFYARAIGAFGFMLGLSYVLAIPLGVGLPGIYAGMIVSYIVWAAVVTAGFQWGNWAERAAGLMAERAAADA